MFLLIWCVLRRKKSGWDNFILYLCSKIVEVAELLIRGKQILIKIPLKYNCFEIDAYHNKCIKALKDFICYNQGMILNQSYMTSLLHKKIKDELREPMPDKALLKGYNNDLNKKSHDWLISAIDGNFIKILNFFEGRTENEDRTNRKPRVCIKVYEDIKRIGTFRRDSIKDYYFTGYEVDKNTGFHNAHTTGKHYLCNNIPRDSASDDYRNPRIDSLKARKYYKDFESNGKHDRDKWIDCWHNLVHEENPGNNTLGRIVRPNP
jgi:hypothetical protein